MGNRKSAIQLARLLSTSRKPITLRLLIGQCGLDLEHTPYPYYPKHYVEIKEKERLMSIKNLLGWLSKRETGKQDIADELCIKNPSFREFWKVFGTLVKNIYRNYKNELVIHCSGCFIRPMINNEFLAMYYDSHTGLVKTINVSKLNLDELWKRYL